MPTNKSGPTDIDWDPCKAIPASTITQLQLDSRPPEPDSLGKGGTGVQVVRCKYRAQSGYYLSVNASNYTLDMDKKDPDHWDYQDFEINGRKALSYILSPRPRTTGCAIDVSASTGVYGVLVNQGVNGFAPYPDCLTAARKNVEALLPYFPS